jgi:hypothetical protein
MICGNKNTLGNSIMSALVTGDTKILTDDELAKIKESNRMFLELWGE